MSKKPLLLLLFLLPLLVHGGGYQVNLMGIRYSGMGHIGTSLSLDAGSVFFNPGNLGFIPSKFSFTGGISGIISYNQFRYAAPSTTQANTSNPLGTPFTVFGMGKISDKFAVGLGVYTPFGSAIKWDDNWVGKYLVQKISFKTILIQPTLSYKICDKLGIGAGLVFAYGNVDLRQALPPVDTMGQAGSAHLKAHTTNWGFNAGIAYHPTEALSIGFSYRSKVNMNVKNGTATFMVPGALSSTFPAGSTFNSSLPLPASWNLGVSYKITDKFLLGADVNFVQWKTYDSLVFDFSPASIPDSRDPKLYKNTFIFRLGGQYQVSDKFWVRAGAYYDNSPVQSQYMSPETPDANRIGLSAGISVFPVKGLSIDASFVFTDEMKRSASYAPKDFSGTYKSLAYVPGIGITYNF